MTHLKMAAVDVNFIEKQDLYLTTWLGIVTPILYDVAALVHSPLLLNDNSGSWIFENILSEYTVCITMFNLY